MRTPQTRVSEMPCLAPALINRSIGPIPSRSGDNNNGNPPPVRGGKKRAPASERLFGGKKGSLIRYYKSNPQHQDQDQYQYQNALKSSERHDANRGSKSVYTHLVTYAKPAQKPAGSRSKSKSKSKSRLSNFSLKRVGPSPKGPLPLRSLTAFKTDRPTCLPFSATTPPPTIQTSAPSAESRNTRDVR
ncbi:hypothetical protein MBM_00907 [Drepanopeziza brunnea f. sp. 'multigermtubi' MB_m1]|uniref:Uncharacterized protein n=1 Tax=Marssonina brunnea f. sp. multigermtubi (strain MB_m1) TaxID=1072389 RepID=K1Y9E7_MARBU|nr:uncharacterized protein MBM_00907 [Drepanopeziza brunnea f. sp. 'multigermtubi' MB_m1]EKD21794.1 hypothetical protein MBM_00907 [Drepanopeziza brunnea f. sp. 'multigermtubi' MB_m1]